MKKFAVIVAGGTGTRMGTEKPKQFLTVQGKPVLAHSIERFVQSFADVELVVVLPAGFMEEGRAIGDSVAAGRIQYVTGGNTRFESVQRGLEKVAMQSIVFVHDAARCLVSTSLIRSCYEQAVRSGSAVPAIASRDSVRLVQEDGLSSKPFAREQVRFMQTPQTFLSDLLLPAYRQPYQESFTDEATVVEAAGHIIQLIPGEETNIKITTPPDLVLAENLLRSAR